MLVSIATETADSPHIDRESLKLLVRPVTASNGWRADELSTIDGSGDADIATRRSDGTTAAWYRGVQTCHAPGARTNWHSLVNGQLLVWALVGIGLVGTRDGTTVVLRAR